MFEHRHKYYISTFSDSKLIVDKQFGRPNMAAQLMQLDLLEHMYIVYVTSQNALFSTDTCSLVLIMTGRRFPELRLFVCNSLGCCCINHTLLQTTL